MRNDGRGDIPIVEFSEELAGRRSGFGAIDREFANRHAFWASTHPLNFIQLGHHVVATREREGGQASHKRSVRAGIESRGNALRRGGGDRARWDRAVLEIPKDDVLVPVVIVRCGTHLGPFPS